MARPTLQPEPTEVVLISVRPHYKYLFKPAIAVIIVMSGTIIVLWRWHTAPDWTGFMALGIYLACILYMSIKVFQWRAKNMTVTSTRIIFSSGIFQKIIREIPNFKINSWYQHSSLWQRIFKAGTVILEVPEIQFVSETSHKTNRIKQELASLSHPTYEVSNPEGLAEAIRQAVLPYRMTATEVFGSTQSVNTIARQLSLLADLHRAGAITDEEFKEKSQEILNNAY
ncbi:MAG: PH domain-containing protein [Firmicutes bacterium]|nr:PH domain-containing protein [Bacillota bacterium]